MSSFRKTNEKLDITNHKYKTFANPLIPINLITDTGHHVHSDERI